MPFKISRDQDNRVVVTDEATGKFATLHTDEALLAQLCIDAIQRPGWSGYFKSLVTVDATPQERDSAYRALVRLAHPDKNLAAKPEDINTAYANVLNFCAFYFLTLGLNDHEAVRAREVYDESGIGVLILRNGYGFLDFLCLLTGTEPSNSIKAVMQGKKPAPAEVDSKPVLFSAPQAKQDLQANPQAPFEQDVQADQKVKPNYTAAANAFAGLAEDVKLNWPVLRR